MRYGFLLLALAMLLGMALQGFAARTPPGPKSYIKGDYAVMVTELKLPDDQQVKLGEKIQAMTTALAAWDQANKEKVTKFKADLKAAQQAKDAAAQKAASDQLAPLTAERTALSAKLQGEVMAVLTPEQQQTWAGILLYRKSEYAAAAKALKLTPEQEAPLKAKVIAGNAAMAQWDANNAGKVTTMDQQIKDLQAQLAKLTADKNALVAQRAKLDAEQKAAATAILTPEQRNAWEAIKLQAVVEKRFKAASLTPEQIAKLKPLCEGAVNQMSQLAAADAKGRTAVLDTLYKTITDQVLTDAQRAAMK